jgi:hypothetical protein
MTMRIFSVIFLITVLISATKAYGGGGFIPNINITFIPIPLNLPIGGTEPLPPQTPPKGFWFKPDADRELLRQDYGECRVKGILIKGEKFERELYDSILAGEKYCMKAKGYTWLTPGTGFWHKTGTDIEQLKQDYAECRDKDEKSCMTEKGYAWATF